MVGLFLLVWAVLVFRPIATSAQSLTNNDPIQRALELAAQSGYYDYKSFVEQTTYPAPRVANAGRAPKIDQLGLGGTADADAEMVEMTLWQDGSFDPTTGIDMQVRDGRSYARRSPTAEWEEIGNVSDQIAPDGDPMVWFEAMTNVQQQETQTFPFADGASVTLTRYSFDVDGPTFGKHMGDLMYQRAALETPLPRGVRSQIPESYRNLTGTGDLWIDADGLPSRIALDLDYGEQKNGERVSAEMQIDFTNFDRQAIGGQYSVFGIQSSLLSYRILNTEYQTRLLNTVVILSTLALLTYLAVRYHNRRSFYIGYVSLIIFSMVFLPIIDGAVAYAFMEHTQQRQAEHAARVANVERQQAQRDAFYGNVEKEERYSVNSIQYSVAGQLNTEYRTLNTSSATATDTDGDGLSDEDEAYWGTCAYDGAATDCDGVLDATDSDADGLTDGDEVNSYNTDPTLSDSDSDGIFDALEAAAFTYNGVAYQLDPNDNDSNNDGLTDGEECFVWVDGAESYDADAICPDSDGDGSPDPFDDDNDDDGVLDLADISPNSSIDEIYTNDNPLELSVDNLTVDQPVIVQLDFRPTTDDHLTFSSHVLDWPSGDSEGQIQRQLDTTFADTENTDALSTDDNAANGDVRLIPMIEIQMPYSDGHYSNLPITATASADRVLGEAVDDWIDDTELDGYGITIQDADLDSGLLSTYLPLTSVTDANSDTVQAFSAVMYYTPSQGTNDLVDWGEAHQYRLVWLVQMLTDECVDDTADAETCEREDVLDIIHVYQDEWQLTGLSISEEHGIETAILYEDPAADDDLDSPELLTAVAWNLASTFINGYDCDLSDGDTCSSDGTRDVTLATLDDTIDGWTSGTNYLVSSHQTGIHRDQASTLFSADTTTILEDAFTTYADQTDPSLLYLQEATYRTRLLEDYADVDGTITFDFADVEEAVSAAMEMATYTYDDGWEEYDSQDYIALMQWQLAQDDDYFTLAGSDSEADLDGKLIWVNLFYSALYSGIADVVEVDGDAIYVYNPDDVLATGFDVVDLYAASDSAMFAILSLILDVLGTASFYADDVISFAQTGQLAAGSGPGSPYPTLIKSLQRSNVGGNLLIGVAVGILLFGIILLVAGILTDSEFVTQIGEVTIQFANAIFMIQFAIKVIKMLNIIKAVGSSTVSGTSIALSLGMKFVVMLIVAVVVLVLIGVALVAIYLVQYAGRYDTYEGQAALSYIIASILVLMINVIAFILAFALVLLASTGVGLILLAIFAIVELILTAIGVDSVTERLTNAIVNAIYKTDEIIENLSASDRLDINIDDIEYGDDDLGLTTANSLKFVVGVTNTVETDEGFDNARQATFDYQLSQESADNHENLNLSDIYNEWEEVSDDELQMTRSEALTDPIELATVGSGINRSLDGYLYLVEGYEVPFFGCWRTGIYNSCKTYSFDGSSPINLGDSLIYDILPATLAEFAVFTPSDTETRASATEWNRNGAISFPEQQDQDNDGLLSIEQGGTDPNDYSADTDGDFLTDYYEQIVTGTDPEDADSDDDGLTDYEENIYYTDPQDADSDDDGLTDYTEVIEGWLVTVTAADGSLTTMRVWSDPWLADADEDSLNDLQEYIFGFHPEIETDPSIIENLIQINDMSVDEADQAVLWLEMEENSGVSVFSDSSGERHTAYCTDDTTCPTAAADGKFGDALSFDGDDDYLTVTDGDTIDFADGDFTVMAWVYRTDSRFQSVLAQDDGGDIGWEFGLSSSNSARFVFHNDDGLMVSGGGTVTQDSWHHIAATRDSVDERVKVYVDGVQVDSDNNRTGSLNTDLPLLIGRTDDSTDTNQFTGSIDDLLVYERVLSVDEIVEVMDGRINTNDLYVQPGQELTYSANVTNTSGTNNAYGHLVGTSAYTEPEIAAPEIAIGFEPDEWIVEFANDTGDSIAPTCVKNVSCPEMGANAWHGSAIEFSDASQFVTLPTIGTTIEAVFAFWLRVNQLPDEGEFATVIETDRDGNALNVYLNSDGNLILSLDGGETALVTSEYNFGDNLWSYAHVGYDITDTRITLFIDGVQDGSFVEHSTGEFSIGPGTLGNSADGTQPLTGRFDELFYQAEESNEDGDFTRIRSGNYEADYEGQGQPEIYRDVVFRFDESADISAGDYFADTDTAICFNEGSCPTITSESASGYAVEFDGVNDQIELQDGSSSEDFTIEFSFYMYDKPDSGEEDYLIYNYHQTQGLHIKIDSSGYLIADADDVGTHTSSSKFSTYTWYTVRLEYDQTSSDGNYYYTSDLYIDDDLDSSVEWYAGEDAPSYNVHFGSSRLGIGLDDDNNATGAFNGILDDITSTTYDITFDVETPATTVIRNLVDDTTMWTCSTPGSCPEVDSSGAHGEAIAFGTNDAVTLDEMFHLQGDFTIAFWVKSSSYNQQEIFQLTDSADNDDVVRAFLTTGTPTVYYYDNEDGALNSVAATLSGSRMDGGEWRHYALVLNGTELSFYENGEADGFNSTQTVDPFNGKEVYLTLGQSNTTDDLYPLVGSLDELLYIPEATSEAGVQALMNSTWPAIEIVDEFVTFSADPNTSTTVSGSATVNEDAPDGLYAIEEEVEAALALQDETVSIPIVDTYSNDLDIFLPFEEVPGATVFQNIGKDEDYTCSGTGCPTTGLRGIIDRAAYFDGIDDGIVAQSTRGAISTRARDSESVSYSFWVKGESGTIFDTDDKSYEGLEADFSQMKIHVDSGTTSNVKTSTLDYTIPQNVWTHVAFTLEDDNDENQLDEDGIAKVYINGVLADETTYYRDSNSSLNEAGDLSIGRTERYTDFFKGYIDDFRQYYDVILTDDEILALYQQSAPVMRFEFDEESDVSSYGDSIGGLVGYPTEIITTVEDAEVTVLSPAPGTDGQIGNVALFDGTGVIEVADSEDVVNLTDDFTIMLWVNTESTDVGLVSKEDGDVWWESGERIFYLNSSGYPTFEGHDNRFIKSQTAVNDGFWHHLVVTWDSAADSGTIYVDGVDVTSSSSYPPTNEDNSNNTLHLGRYGMAGDTYIFDGKMDELVIYQRALTSEESASIYLREVRWYRDHHSASVRVDTDNPTIELLTTSDYFADGYVQLAVNTDDASSSVRLLEIGLKSPSDSDYTWWSAPECTDTEMAATVWCPYFTTTGEGSYEVVFRAVDVVGNETTSSAYTFTVDDTAPTASSSYSATEIDATADTSSDGLSWTLSLNGTVSDDTSGVYADTVAVTLVDARGETLGGGMQRATVSGDTWSVAYEIDSVRPVGEITVLVSAEDEVGNQSEQTVGTIVLDERAPSVALNARTITDTYSTTVTFEGTVIEQPDWYGKVLDLHFEDELLDSSDEQNDATCTTCPSYFDGVFGRAANFGAADVVSAEIENITDTLTLAAWFYPTDSGETNIISLGDGKAQISLLGDENIKVEVTTAISGTHTISSSVESVWAEEWSHIALTWDGATLIGYINGISFGSLDIDDTLIDGTTVTIGDAEEAIPMRVDEVQIYSAALTSSQLYALAASNVAGVSSVEYWLEQVFTDNVRLAETWQTATLAETGDAFSAWSADVPADGEGFYQLNIRSTDANANESGDYVAWRGQLDDLAPRLTLAAEYVGMGVAAQTEYSFTAEDLLLDPDQLETPCVADDIEFTDTDSTDSATASCTVDGHGSGVTVASCDYAGNCDSAEFTPTDNTTAPHLVPENEAQAALLGDTVTLSGTMSAGNGLSFFMIAVGETEIYTETFNTRSTTETSWSYEWEAIGDGEVRLNVYLEDQNGLSTMEQIVVTVDATPTAVTLLDFAASVNADNAVTLDWETEAEIDHAGFHIYRRAANSRSNWTQVNDTLIASLGTQAQGSAYQYVDADVPAGEWEYVLEDVELDGDTYQHSEHIATIQVGTPTAVTLSQAEIVASTTAIWLMSTLLFVITAGFVHLQRRRRNLNTLER